MGAFDGKVGEILRRAEAAGHDQGIEVVGVGFADVLDIAAGNAGRFNQYIARLGHFFAGRVVDHMHLRDVRCKALHLGSALVQAQQGDHALMDFRTVVHTAARKNHCNFFAHACYSCLMALMSANLAPVGIGFQCNRA
ncbi:hypothetical protein D3C87_1797670 [compost metagenome]